mmetsp:Transcript_123268/g.343197  ORF Transcript_123268/g.343197 Transcript_123268/m.343197 type:complete len:230 (+) Transcript_123268:241-930(+)
MHTPRLPTFAWRSRTKPSEEWSSSVWMLLTFLSSSTSSLSCPSWLPAPSASTLRWSCPSRSASLPTWLSMPLACASSCCCSSPSIAASRSSRAPLASSCSRLLRASASICSCKPWTCPIRCSSWADLGSDAIASRSSCNCPIARVTWLPPHPASTLSWRPWTCSVSCAMPADATPNFPSSCWTRSVTSSIWAVLESASAVSWSCRTLPSSRSTCCPSALARSSLCKLPT